MSKTISEIYNRVINHAITLGIDADQFLTCWREGDWAGCREFGFEPDIDGVEGSAQRTSLKPLNERILAALEESTSALFYLVEAKHGPKTASEYPEIVAARAAISDASDLKSGFAVVPKRLTKAMSDLLSEEGWEWADVLAAAEAITEEEYAKLVSDDQTDTARLPDSAEASKINDYPSGD